jgi:hypothetical protein
MPNPLTLVPEWEAVTDAIEAEEFQDCAFYGIKLAEEVEDWVVRDNMLRLVRAWLAAAQDVQNATDDVRLSFGAR